MSTYFLQVACTLALVYALYYWSLRRMTHHAWTRSFLLFGLGLAWLLPPVSMWLAQAKPVAGVQAMLPVFYGQSIEVSSLNFIEFAEPTWSWIDWAWLGYGIISGLVLIRLLLGLSRIWRHYRRGERQKFQDYVLVIHPAIRAPFSFLGAVFVSPQLLAEKGPGFDRMLQHELAHIKGWHSIDILLVELTRVVLWWHPLLPAYRRALRQSHEYLADHAVLQLNETDKRSYGHQLLAVLNNPGQRLEDELAHHFYHTFISKRLQMMNKIPSHPLLRWKYALLLPVLLTAVVLFAGSKNYDLKPLASENELSSLDSLRPGAVVFQVVEEMPLFGAPTGESYFAKKEAADQAFLEYVYSRIKYPPSARQGGNAGTVVIKFIIAEDGSMQNLSVVRNPGGGLGEAALAVFEEMRDDNLRWTPGRQNGRAVNVQWTMPIQFKLEWPDGTEAPEQHDQNNVEETSELASAGSKIVVVGYAAPPPPQAEATFTGPEGSDLFRVVEEMPRFPGCEELPMAERNHCAQQKMLEYIYTNIKYPATAREQQKEGMSVVRFVVEQDGSLSNIEVLRDPGAGLGAEALRIVTLMNEQNLRWVPGRQAGERVRVQFNLPIKFKLEYDNDSPPVEEILEGRPAGLSYGAEDVIRLGSPTAMSREDLEYFLNDEYLEIGHEALEGIDPNTIAEVNILKGEAMEGIRQNPSTVGIIQIYTKDYVAAHPRPESPAISFTPDEASTSPEKSLLTEVEEQFVADSYESVEFYVDGELLPTGSIPLQNTLQPQDIESIHVIKAEAEVLALRQRANTTGIIQITTKQAARQRTRAENRRNRQEQQQKESLILEPIEGEEFDYYIDGVLSDEATVEAMDPDEIEHIEIIAEEALLREGFAIEGLRGIVQVTTKAGINAALSVTSEDAFASVELLPDPATHQLRVNYSLLNGRARSIVRVFDLQGRLLHSQNFESSEVQAEFELQAMGIYIVNIEKDGQIQAYKVML